VLVRDRSNDPGCDGCVRVTIGTREQIREAAMVLRRTMRELRGEENK
jgi:histidinol-phosphate aminotransferase